MQAQLFVLVIDQDPFRASLIREGLAQAGHTRVETICDMNGLARRVQDLSPDVVIVDLQNPHRDLVEHLFLISGATERPVAMFVDQSDAEMLASAIDAGVSAYIVDGLRKDRVSAIVDMAIARFNAYAHLRRELSDARRALQDRKALDRAKALLMKARGLSEDEAHRLIRTQAMRSSQRMGEVARALLAAAEMLAPDAGGEAPAPPAGDDHG